MHFAEREVRSLVLSSKPLYPPRGGSSLRNWQNISALRKLGPVAAFSVQDASNASLESEPPGLEWSRSHRVVRSKSGGLATAIARYRWICDPVGHPFAAGLFTQTHLFELSGLVKEFQPELVLLEEPWMHPYLDSLNGAESIVFDAHDVQARLRKEMAASERGFSRLRKIATARRARVVEGGLVRRANQVWACSSGDAKALGELYAPVGPVRVVPNAVDVGYYADVASRTVQDGSCDNDARRRTVLFVGNFSYLPNAEAAEALFAEVYPRLCAHSPDWRVMLVGVQPSRAMIEAAQRDSRIVVTGMVEDVRPYLAQAGVVVVPLRSGGGTRIKILEAFAARVPVVSTTKGVEGIDARDHEHLLVADEISTMVDHVLALAADDELRDRLINSAFRLVNESYSWDAIERNVQAAVRSMPLG